MPYRVASYLMRERIFKDRELTPMAVRALGLTEAQAAELNTIAQEAFDRIAELEMDGVDPTAGRYTRQQQGDRLVEKLVFDLVVDPEGEAEVRDWLAEEIAGLGWAPDRIEAAQALILSSPDFMRHDLPRRVYVQARNGKWGLFSELHGWESETEISSRYMIKRSPERMPFLYEMADSYLKGEQPMEGAWKG